MAMSLDGKISTHRREDISLGSEHDRRLMDELRADADAVIVGSGTVAHDGFPILMRYDDLEARRVDRGWPRHPMNVTMSRALSLPSTRRLADVVVLPGHTLSPTAVLENLRQRGASRVLLEGGGEVHFAFAKEGVIDEVFITLTPRLIGGANAPTVLDGKGFLASDHIELRLLSTKRVGDELYLRYGVDRG
jgi:2,5-diamino-6-(ribosylamino)-4(3H)-pyrimidinone 5'-phosphate reductase